MAAKKVIEELGLEKFNEDSDGGQPFWSSTWEVKIPKGYWEAQELYECKPLNETDFALTNADGKSVASKGSSITFGRSESAVENGSCVTRAAIVGLFDDVTEELTFSSKELSVDTTIFEILQGDEDGKDVSLALKTVDSDTTIDVVDTESEEKLQAMIAGYLDPAWTALNGDQDGDDCLEITKTRLANNNYEGWRDAPSLNSEESFELKTDYLAADTNLIQGLSACSFGNGNPEKVETVLDQMNRAFLTPRKNLPSTWK